MNSESTRFNSYFVLFDYPEASYCGNIVIDGESHYITLKRVEHNTYILFFKSQVALHFGQQVEVKKREQAFTVMLPLLSKYNERKLKKVAAMLTGPHKPAKALITEFLAVEKFLEVEKLLTFFRLAREEVLAYLVEQEARQAVKIIDLCHLSVTSHKNFKECEAEMRACLGQAYEKREKTVKLATIERQVKLPASSMFFRYLLRILQEPLNFRLIKDKIIFQKLPLSEEEKTRIGELEKILKRNKLQVFGLEKAEKVSGFPLAQVNDALWYMLEEEIITQIDEQNFIFTEELNKIINRLKKFLRNQGDTIDIQAFREISQLNRQQIIAVLEYLDAQQITRRVGNSRKILLSV